jgi:flavin reductase (DIM6/NTAB) family NADH-FMN oxidoreductase RutF
MITDEIDQQRRMATRQFATGVAVLTAWHAHAAQGTTVSAVATLSRQPLLLGVCLRRGSAFAALANTAGRFAMNVLDAQQARLAGWFADPARPVGPAQFDHVDWETELFSGAPLLAGCLAGLGCRLSSTVAVGDHELLIAEVVTSRYREGAPLLSYGGQLHDSVLRLVARKHPHPARS